MTTPSATPVPSKLPQDLLFNAEKLDQVVNSGEHTYVDRRGVTRQTAAGATASIRAINVRGNWATATAYSARDVVKDSGSWWICVDAHTSSAAFATDAAKWRVYQGVTGADLMDAADPAKASGQVAHTRGLGFASGTVGAELDAAVKNDSYPPAGTAAAVVISFDTVKAAMRYGGSDLTPQNDERNFWRGLPSQDAWGDPDNIGPFSNSLGRNGASLASYSNTLGHDCVTYGVASTAGGAGSCTGDPDDYDEANNKGYCAFAHGKNTQAKGKATGAIGEETFAGGRASFSAGYKAISDEASASHPAGVADSGLGATALGNEVAAYGDGAAALGQYINAYDGATLIGSGINPGSRMQATAPGAVGIGSNTTRPTLEALPGGGTTADKGSLIQRGKTEFRGNLGGNTDFVLGELVPVLTNSGGGGYGGVHLRPVVAGATVDGFMVSSDSGVVSLLPWTDNAMRIGSAGLRPAQYYGANTTISSSDERLKTDIEEIPAAWLRAWARVEFVRYRWRDAVAEKGGGARWHVGVIAQRVKAAFEAEGVNAFEVGILCYDKWDAADAVVDSNGEVLRPAMAAGDRYSVRYEQALVLESALARYETALLRARLSKLEATRG